MDTTFLVVLVIVVALTFDYTNGFHDAANAIATTVSTKALPPRAALAMAAILNLVGALVSTKVASTVGKGIIDAPAGRHGLIIVMAALCGAILWNVATWFFGLPSSSSHALIGGLIGAALAASETVKWAGIRDKVLIPMIVSPLVGFSLGFIVMLAILWAFRKKHMGRTQKGFRYAQIGSAAMMSFGHGTQDAQKTMGVIALALYTSGHLGKDEDIPLWVILAAATALAAGTYAAGWRIIRTLGRRLYALTPANGFAAETVASTVMFTTAHYGLPVSTTHTITSAVLGVGATRRLSAVRWGVAGNIVAAWILTIPGAATIAAASYWLLNLLIG